jgi:hypothetical protein
VAAREQPLRVQVGRALELHDAGRDLVGVRLLLVRVLEELGRHRLRVDAGRHVEVPLVAQDAHDLGGQRLVQDLHDGLAVGLVAFRDGTVLDVLARPLPQRLDVGEELVGH